MPRQPTSHERRAGEAWDASYRDRKAPWDLGRPQPALAELAAAGGFSGRVLDSGCGNGEHALMLAALGLPVLGVDVAETAIALAREKAAARSLDAEFEVADALDLARLDRSFDAVLDCGLFHTFDGGERREYVASVASVTEPGATLHVLCFSDARPDSVPHPVAREEIELAFGGPGWSLTEVRPSRIETTFAPAGLPAWLVRVART
jgi:SAM-dependent methyltransferase